MAKAKIGNRNVGALKAGDQLFDSEVRGFNARCLPSGEVQFSYRYVSPTLRTRRRITIGIWGGEDGALTVDKAREKAKSYQGRVVDKIDPIEAVKEASAVAIAKKERDTLTLAAVFDEYFAPPKEGEKKDKGGPGFQLRSADELQRIYDVNIHDDLGSRSIFELKRSHVTALLDKIKRGRGPVMALRTLALLRQVLNWQVTRSDNFVSPIVRGMAENISKTTNGPRERTLEPAEIKLVWEASKANKSPELTRFGTMVRLLFLTACRRDELAGAQDTEIKDHRPPDKVAEHGWILEIPGERVKNGKPHVVPLTDAARSELAALERRKEETKVEGDRPYLFSRYGAKPFSGFSKAKAALDAEVLELMKKAVADRGENPAKVKKLERWTLHDIRRTCRTIMSGEGVSSDVAERVLGHVIGGVRGVYDRYGYLPEKRAALEKLATRLAIITSDAKNVVTLKRA